MKQFLVASTRVAIPPLRPRWPSGLASASRAASPRSSPVLLVGLFSRLIHTSGILLATLPGALWFRISVWSGWTDVSRVKKQVWFGTSVLV